MNVTEISGGNLFAADRARRVRLPRDTLFVDVGGDLKRHPRASEAELKTLLDGKAAKDQVGHWYEAQLIHYGLARSKEKNAAKVRLQQALNQGKGKLKVPPHIADMQAQMKKEYAGAVRKAKAQTKSALGGASAAAIKPQKRKNEEVAAESSKKTKISMTVGDVTVNIEHGTQASATKKSSSKASAKEAAAEKPAARKTAAPKQKDVGATPKALKTAKSEITAPSPRKPSAAAQNKASKAAQFWAGSPPPSSTKPKPEPKVKAEPKVQPQPKAKPEPKVKSQPKVKAEPKVKPEPKIKPEPKVKKEPTIKRAIPAKKETKVKAEETADPMDIDSFTQEMPGTRNVTGVYTLSCPQLADELPEQANNFRLFLCVDNGITWGSFELGMKSGVIRMDEVGIGRTVSFGWRARDSLENNRLSFGRGCFGELELHGHEQVRGTFRGLFNEPMVFDGSRRPGLLWCGRSAYSFQQEWDGFVTQAYGR